MGSSGANGGDLTPAKIDGWVSIAQPRARMVYHAGVALTGAPAGVADRLRLLADHGLVILNLARTGDASTPIRWLATRTEKPVPKELAALKPVVRPSLPPACPVVTKGRQRPLGPGGREW